MSKIRVGVVGATGYTGEELLRILSRHPMVEVTLATSEKFAGKKGRLTLRPLSDDEVNSSCQLVFSCLPHKEAARHVAAWIQAGLKVVDLSADFRFRSREIYEKWYQPHPAPELLPKAVYGLPEFHREEIRKAQLVGNPGCYPTGALLGLIPLLREGLISAEGLVIDSKSGISGAGREEVEGHLRNDSRESVHAYKVGLHRHTPEIEQELSVAAGRSVIVAFTPHLIPMERGLLSTIYAQPSRPIKTAELLAAFRKSYLGEPFVQILEGEFPKTKEVTGTNLCRIGALSDPRTGGITVITAIDNLMKGASGQAVQNMNLIFGFGETIGLKDPTITSAILNVYP